MTKSLGLFVLLLAAAADSHAGLTKSTNSCTQAVVNDLTPQFVKNDLQSQGTTVTECALEDLDRTDPTNPGDTIHYVATLKCDGQYVPLYVLNATHDSATSTCVLSNFDVPPPVAPAPSTPLNWSIDQFVAELEANRFSTIEQALLSLPDAVRSSFTLLHEGHGLRGTSPSRPGVILFSTSGEYAITFGDESQDLGNELEIFRFDLTTNRGELVRAAFPPENPEARRFARTNGVTVEKNPAQCTTCHRADPMLRWGTYGTWKGAYGSNDDTIDPNGSDAETRSFLSFMSARTALPRYRTLLPPTGETGILPYWDNSPVAPYTALSKDGRSSLRPNFRLGAMATLVDARRLARKMMESPEYAKNRAQLLHSMLNCEANYPNFAATLAKLGIEQVDLQPNILETLDPAKLPEYSDGFSSYGPGRNSVVDYAAGIIYRDLVTAHPDLGGTYWQVSAYDYLSPNYWVFGQYPETAKTFADLRTLGSYVTPKSAAARKDFCGKLQELALSSR